MTVFLLMLLVAVPHTVTVVAACVEPTSAIPDLVLRAPSNRLLSTQLEYSYMYSYMHSTSLNDSALPAGWYTASESNLSSNESAAVLGACGTLYPIILKEPLDVSTLGTTAQNVPVWMPGLLHGSDNPRAEWHILARKCSDTVQFYLEPPPIRFAAYCFEPTQSPSEDVPPVNEVTGVASIHAGLGFEYQTTGGVETSVPFIQLGCRPSYYGSYDPLATRANVTLQWFAEGTEVLTVNGWMDLDYWKNYKYDITGIHMFLLNESVLIENGFGFGSEIACRLDVSTNGTSDTTSTIPTTFRGGPFVIGAFQQDLYVYPGQTHPIMLTHTTPIGCTSVPGDGRLNCTLHADIVDEEGNSLCVDTRTDTTRHDRCGFQLIGLTQAGWEAYTESNGNYFHSYFLYSVWSSNNGHAYGSLSLPLEDDEDNTNMPMYLKLKTGSQGTGHTIWEDKTLPTDKVQFSAAPTGGPTWEEDDFRVSCSAYGSSFYTYDQSYGGETTSFTNVGEFILYRSSRDLVEVQIKTQTCADGVCVCGVFTRVKNDIQAVYICDGTYFSGHVAGDGSHIQHQDSAMSPGYAYFNIAFSDGNINVNTYTGTSDGLVELNVHVSGGSPGNKIEGVCSRQVDEAYVHQDGTYSTDFTAFADSWEVPEKNSLMSPLDLITYGYTEEKHYCVCPGKNVEIAEKDTVNDHYTYHYTGAILCSPSQAFVCTKTVEGSVWPDTLLPDYILGKVAVTPATHEDDPYFQLLCNFTAVEPYKYNVKWYIKGVSVRNITKVTKDQLSTTALLPAMIQAFAANGGSFCLVDSISCSVDVLTDDEVILTENSKSSDFYPIQVSTTNVQLLRGSDAAISVSLNIPFIATSTDGRPLELDFRFFDPEDPYDCSNSTVAFKGKRGCGGQIESVTPAIAASSGFSSKSITARLTTKNNDAYNLRQFFKLKLKSVVSLLANSFWNCDLSEIQVDVVDVIEGKGKYCYAHVDPHMFTFDGKAYEMQLNGIFTLVTHGSKLIEVQMRTGQCNGQATCACAVAVRVGGDVFVIDHCNGNHFTGFISGKNPFLSVYYRKGLRYQFILPGTSMVVDVDTMPYWGYWMNVDIFISPTDIHQVSGLCGTYNNNAKDDLLWSDGLTTSPPNDWSPNEFSSSWSVTDPLKSLFNPENDWDDLKEDEQKCICPNEHSHLSDSDFLCSANEDRTCVKEKPRKGKKVENRFRDRRSGPMHPEHRERITRSSHDYQQHEIVKRSTVAVNVTQEKKLCQQWFVVNCSAYNETANMTGFVELPKETLLENCASDFKTTGVMDWASTHCRSLSIKVENEMAKSPVYAKANPEIAKSYENGSCGESCERHGSCVKGSDECVCDEGFIGDDCEVPDSEYPTITYTPPSCDRTASTCECFLMEGEKFVQGHSQCELKHYEVQEVGSSVFIGTRTYFLEVQDPTLAYCCITYQRERRSTTSTPLATQYELSVSNNGVNYGTPQTIYVLDTTCQETITLADGSTQLVLKSRYCYISGTCVAQASTNPASSCDMCDAAISAFSWTTTGCTTVANPPSDQTMLNAGYIALIVVSSALLIGVIIIVLIVKFKKATAMNVQPFNGPPVKDPFSVNTRFNPRNLPKAWTEKMEQQH